MRGLRILCQWLELVAVTIWLGGAVVLGVVVAPAAFRVIPTREVAGDLMARVFTVFNGPVAITCLTVAMIAFVGIVVSERGLPAPPRRVRARRLEGAALLGLLLLNLYLGRFLTPEMDRLRATIRQPPSAGAPQTSEAQAEQAQRFLTFHRRIEGLFTVNFAVGLGFLFLKGRELARPREEHA